MSQAPATATADSMLIWHVNMAILGGWMCWGGLGVDEGGGRDVLVVDCAWGLDFWDFLVYW